MSSQGAAVLKRCSVLVAALAMVLFCHMSLAAQTASQSAPAKTAAKSAKTSTAPMDINSATADQLKMLPGVDDATAQKIIAGRPYRAKNQLVSRKILSQAGYDKNYSARIIARQAAAKPAGTAKPSSTPAK